MNAEVFLDTNIVIYAYSAQETDKFEAANRLIDAGTMDRSLLVGSASSTPSCCKVIF